MKTYFHVDMDAFFVSVEELFDPSLKGKPVVVGGRPISAAWSRRRPMRRASSVFTPPCRCAPPTSSARKPSSWTAIPSAIANTRTRSSKCCKSFSPQVDMASVDEAYMDLTGTERLHGPPLSAAHRLHEAMKRATDLNCSIGIAASRMVAKVGVRSSQAQRRSLGAARARGPLPGAARCPQDPRRRQGDREESARLGHSQGRRSRALR